MSVYAKRTKQPGMRDYLFIDHYFKKKALITLVKESAKVHQWDNVLDFSFHIENEHNFKPSFKTKLLRRVKFLPVIKNIYNYLLRSHVQKATINVSQKIKNKLAESQIMVPANEEVAIYQLTQTELNAGAEYLYPNAKVFYMEHGTVDYIYVINKIRKDGFICIFKESYDKYLAKRNISFPVYPCLNKEEFTNAFLDFIPRFNLDIKQIETASKKRFVLFLMDALEIYQVNDIFWTDYIERCLKEIDNPLDYTILVKPHPNQSNEVIEITQAYFKAHNLDYIMLNKPEYISLSVETIYIYYQQRIDFVFTTFSAAIYYLSYFYEDKSKFFYAYYFVGKYIKNAPPQYKNAYTDLESILSEVFVNKHCISLT
jgi:hypothetical protein